MTKALTNGPKHVKPMFVFVDRIEKTNVCLLSEEDKRALVCLRGKLCDNVSSVTAQTFMPCPTAA